MTKEEKAVAFVEDFIKYGFRIDTMPTRKWSIVLGERIGQEDEYQWWHDYVSGAEKRLKDAAKEILNG